MKKILSLVLLSSLALLNSCAEKYEFENEYYPDGSIINYKMDNDMTLDGKN